MVLASNVGGIFEEDFKKIKRPYTHLEIPISSLPILYASFKRFTQNKLLLFVFKAMVFLLKNLFLIIFKNRNYKHIYNIVEKIKPNLIIGCNGGFPGGISCFDCINVGRIENIRSWLTVVSMPQKKSFIEMLYAKSMISFDKLIVNSHNIADEFIKTRPVLRDKVFVLHNCLPEDEILKEPIKQVQYRTQLTEFKIGYVGRIEHAKGVFYLINAFEKLAHEFSNLKLILVGSGTELEEVKAQCSLKSIEDKIEFTGYYAGKISDIIKTFDLFVFPSLWEGLPYSILEAMANSKVVISTNVGGIPEIITDGVNGFMVSPANSDELYLKMKEIIENRYDIDKIAFNSLNTIHSRFSESFFQNNLQSLFSDLGKIDC